MKSGADRAKISQKITTSWAFVTRSDAKLVPKTEQIGTLGALFSHIELNKSLTPHDMVEMEIPKSPFGAK